MIKIPFPGRQMSIAERNAWTAKLCEIKQAIKNLLHLRNTFGDKIEIVEEYLFYEGTKEQVTDGTARLIMKSKGHIVNTGLIPIINFLACSQNYVQGLGTRNFLTGAPSASYGHIYLGTGGGVTGPTTSNLTIANTTLPSSQSGNTSNPTTGSYRISYLATWNSGILTAITVTEVGLWLCYYYSNATYDWSATLKSFGWAASSGNSVDLNPSFFSRLSVADGDFDSFVVNTAVPLTIEWRLTFSFA